MRVLYFRFFGTRQTVACVSLTCILLRYLIQVYAIVLKSYEIASLVHARRTKLPSDITHLSLATSDFVFIVLMLEIFLLPTTGGTKMAFLCLSDLHLLIIYIFHFTHAFHCNSKTVCCTVPTSTIYLDSKEAKHDNSVAVVVGFNYCISSSTDDI